MEADDGEEDAGEEVMSSLGSDGEISSADFEAVAKHDGDELRGNTFWLMIGLLNTDRVGVVEKAATAEVDTQRVIIMNR